LTDKKEGCLAGMSTKESNTPEDESIATTHRTLEESDEITETVERSMRLLAVIGRVVGWVWMLMLVIATLKVDVGANRTIVIGSMVLATVWTVFSMWAARSRRIFGSLQFVVADVIVILLVGGASWAAGADNLFHGGYLIPTLAVAAYGLNLYGVTLIAGVIAVEQAAILFSWGVGPVPALSSLGFILWGIVFGWLFATIRKTDAFRRATVEELMVERERSVRNSERLELGNRLHDSALQTLLVIDSYAEDSDRVRTLARRQSRELRNLVDVYASGTSTTLKAELVRVAGEVEDLFDVNVSAVIRTDIQMDNTLRALVDAAREAMTNAAKHSGTNRIDLYTAVEDGVVAIYVRDEGKGFDPDEVTEGHGLEHSVRGRVRDVGGDVSIESTSDQGTEVRISAAPQGVSP
jgi:signal transduction histidine kinase